MEATERLKQYVSFTLKKWDCINPLGFARPINPSLNHHSISLKSISTHNVYKLVFGLVWFGFGEQHLVVLSAIIIIIS